MSGADVGSWRELVHELEAVYKDEIEANPLQVPLPPLDPMTGLRTLPVWAAQPYIRAPKSAPSGNVTPLETSEAREALAGKSTYSRLHKHVDVLQMHRKRLQATTSLNAVPLTLHARTLRPVSALVRRASPIVVKLLRSRREWTPRSLESKLPKADSKVGAARRMKKKCGRERRGTLLEQR